MAAVDQGPQRSGFDDIVEAQRLRPFAPTPGVSPEPTKESSTPAAARPSLYSAFDSFATVDTAPPPTLGVVNGACPEG
jgi:hypothetical protein